MSCLIEIDKSSVIVLINTEKEKGKWANYPFFSQFDLTFVAKKSSDKNYSLKSK